MKLLNIIAIILVCLIVLTYLFIVLFKHFNEKILNVKEKLDISINEYEEKSKNKLVIINKFIDQIVNKYKVKNKLFDEIKALKEEDINSENDKLMSKCYKELVQIKEDNQKNKELKVFKELIDEYEDNELFIISLRTFYNTNTLIYNNMIKKLPYNIVSKFKKYKLINILEGKELDTNFNNDLEV